MFDDNELKLVEKKQPIPAENEVLIKIRMAGICNTDLEIIKGYLDFKGILGHEFVGEVISDPFDKLKGKRVVGSINIPCYKCPLCKLGRYNHCLQIKTVGMRNKDGAFAEYLTLPRENIYCVPDSVPDNLAVFVEPLAAAVEITEKIHIKPTDEVLILGDGKLGLITAMALWAMGYDVKMIGKHANKLAIAADLGMAVFYPGEYKGLVDVVVECTGSSSGITTALSIVKPEGKVVLKTTSANDSNINLSKVAVNEIKVFGSRCGPFKPTLRLLEKNIMPIEKMIDSIFPLEEGVQAFARAQEKGVLKVLLKIG